jgi:nucleoside-diphosphate-sugar epimerase
MILYLNKRLYFYRIFYAVFMNLVTGATGLVGSHMLAELIRRGEKVRALYRNERKKSLVVRTLALYFPDAGQAMQQIEWLQCDVLDRYSLAMAMENVQKVYHAAGVVSFGQASEKTMVETNVEGTANVVNACLEIPGIRLCHVSSIAALGITADGSLIHENCNLVPDQRLSAYSKSKFRSEMEVWRGIHEGLQAVIVNPSVILGPGIWNSSTTAFVELVHKGLSHYPKGGVGYVDVRDVTRIMHQLMNSGISGERFIVSAENLSFRDFFTLIALALGKKPPSRPITPWKAHLAIAFDAIRAVFTGKPAKITRRTLRIAGETTAYSSEKIKKQLGMDFIPVKDSVKLISDVYLDNNPCPLYSPENIY